MAGRFSIQGVFTATDRFSGMLGRVEKNVGRFAGSVRAQLSRIDAAGAKAFSGMKQAATGVAVGATIAGASLTAAAMPGLDFGEAIASVGAVSLKTRGEIADLEAEARKLGLTTRFSATEVAKGMETMGRAGFTNAEVISGIAPMLSAAAAEGAEFEPVAEVVSSVIKGMGLAMTETGRVADVLTLASAATKSSILSLGESLAVAGPMAKQFNIPLEQVTASVALLQDVGLDASVAGSAVSTMLNNLANPSKEAKDQLTALGISFQDARGNMLPLEDVLGQFAKGADKAGGNMKQVALFADLLGLRGQKAGQNLRDAFVSGKFKELTDQLKGAAGSAEKMAAIRLDQTKGDLTILKNNALDLGITLFDISSNKLRGVIGATTQWVQANKDVIATMAGEAFTDFVQMVEVGTVAISLFSDGASKGFNAIVGPLSGFNSAFGEWLGSGQWAPVVHDLGTAVGALLPLFVGLVIVSKVARVAMFGFAVATKTVTAAVWLANQAQWAWRAAQIYWIIATNSATAASVRARVAAIAQTAWSWLARAAQIAWTAVTWLAVTAQGGLAVATGGATAAITAARGAIVAAELSLGPLIVTLAAAAAAVGALMVAWNQWKDLEQASGGVEGVKAGIGSFFEGNGFFEGVDAHMNEQARRAAPAGSLPGTTPIPPLTGQDNLSAFLRTLEQPAGAPVPGVAPASQGAQAAGEQQAQVAALIAALEKSQGQKVQIDLKLPPGVGADVKTPQGPGKVPVKVPKTGAFAS